MGKTSRFLLIAVLVVLFCLPCVNLAGAAVTLTWWHTEDPTMAKPYVEIVKAFEKQNKGIKVNLQSIPYDGYTDKFLTSYAAGKAPDIFYNFDLLGFGKRGVAQELTPYIKGKDGVNMRIYDTKMLENFLYLNGKIYAMPRDVGLQAIYYNKDLFDAAGVPYPKSDWTLDDFVAIAKKLTIPEKQQYGCDMVDGAEIQEAFGVHFWDKTRRKVTINTPAFVKFMQWRMDLELKHKVCPTPSMMATLGGQASGGGPADAFKTGKLAMIGADNWSVSQFKEAKMNFGIVCKPHKKGDKVYEGWVGTWSMSANSKHKKEAWKLLKFMTGPKGCEIMAKAWAMPPVLSVMKKIKWDQDPHNKAFADIVRNGRPFESWFNDVPDVWNIMGPYWDMPNILREGNKPIEQVVADVAKQMQEKLDLAWEQVDKVSK
ncbi:MAG: ABC transporter substrate-binding protein [Patescibacteria group bacterium]